MAETTSRYVHIVLTIYAYITLFTCDSVSSLASLDVIGGSVEFKHFIAMFYVKLCRRDTFSCVRRACKVIM